MNLPSNGTIEIPEVVFSKFTSEQLLALSNLPIKVGEKAFVVQSYQKKKANSIQNDNQLLLKDKSNTYNVSISLPNTPSESFLFVYN
jgi:hypothetical protein